MVVIEGKDGAEKRTACLYALAGAAIKDREYLVALESLNQLPDDYLDTAVLKAQSQYNGGLAAMKRKDYAAALSLLESAAGYRDAEAQALKAREALAQSLLDAGDGEGAAALLEKLQDSKNYEKMKKTADYLMAVKAQEAGADIRDSLARFEALGSFEDSEELAREARYQKGLSLLREEKYGEAQPIFLELGQYKDCAAVSEHFFPRRLSEEVSLNQEAGGPLTTTYRYDTMGRISEKTEHFSEYQGMSDRVYVYQYNADGSYSVTEGQVEKHYDPYGAYIGQGDLKSYVYEYEFYEDGTVHYRMDYDALNHQYRGSAAYDEHGNLVGVQGEDGAAYTLMNDYDGGLMMKQERYNEDGNMVSRVSFEYDADGLLKRATFLTPGGGATVTTLYENGPIFAMKLEE